MIITDADINGHVKVYMNRRFFIRERGFAVFLQIRFHTNILVEYNAGAKLATILGQDQTLAFIQHIKQKIVIKGINVVVTDGFFDSVYYHPRMDGSLVHAKFTLQDGFHVDYYLDDQSIPHLTGNPDPRIATYHYYYANENDVSCRDTESYCSAHSSRIITDQHEDYVYCRTCHPIKMETLFSTGVNPSVRPRNGKSLLNIREMISEEIAEQIELHLFSAINNIPYFSFLNFVQIYYEVLFKISSEINFPI
jgi:hypothetical protein